MYDPIQFGRLIGLNEEVWCSPLFKAPWQHYLVHYLLICVVIWAIPPFGYRRYFVLPIMLLHLFWSPLNVIGANADAMSQLLHGFVIYQIFNATVVLLIREIPIEFTDYQLDVGYGPLKPLTWHKWLWAFKRCFLNMRGVGWNWQYPFIDKGSFPTITNKWVFIILKCQLWETWIKYTVYDLSIYLTNRVPFENYPSFVNTLIDTASFLYIVYYGLNVSYYQVATLSLILGLSEVKDWPEQFQLGTGGWTLRSFWSLWWHQYVTCDAVYISRMLTSLTSVSKRFVKPMRILLVFAISGGMHVCGSLNLPIDIGIPWRSALVFIGCGFLLIVEDFLLGSWLRIVPIIIQIFLAQLYKQELILGGIQFPSYHSVSLNKVLS